MKDKYLEILHLSHHEPERHPRMSMMSRAAQFAPFDPLEGYDDAIGETARFTEEQASLGDEQVERIDRQLLMLLGHIREHPEAVVTWFEPDLKKAGGAYRTTEGRVKKIDQTAGTMCFESGDIVPFDRICSIMTCYDGEE